MRILSWSERGDQVRVAPNAEGVGELGAVYQYRPDDQGHTKVDRVNGQQGMMFCAMPVLIVDAVE